MRFDDEITCRLPLERFDVESDDWGWWVTNEDDNGSFVYHDDAMKVINLYRQEVIRLRTKLEMVHDEKLSN